MCFAATFHESLPILGVNGDLGLFGTDSPSKGKVFAKTGTIAGPNFLSDHVVCMTDGPAAEVGEILQVSFPRPRERKEVMEHPDYYRLREQLIEFLEVRAHRNAKPTSVAPTPGDLPPPTTLSQNDKPKLEAITA